MNITVRRPYQVEGRTSNDIVQSVEGALRRGQVNPGERLPPVRQLATELGVSPATVASAYRELHRRGVASGSGRAGTRIRQRPPLATRAALRVPAGVRDLVSGEPDPALLPALPRFKASRGSYTDPSVSPRLRRVAAENLAADGIDPSYLAAVGGALDGVERVLGAWLRPGDRVAVEDPCYGAVLDLLAAMGLEALPVAVDERGARPAGVRAALRQGAVAAIFTPRAQNPTGAAWDTERTALVRRELADSPQVLVVEDDHAGPVSGTPAHSVGGATERWATVRSVSKWLGPDLRLALVAGDEATVARVEGRQALGTGWVSYLLQDAAAELWSRPGTAELLAHASRSYAARRQSLQELLRRAGHPVRGRSGLTTWLPVDDELAVVSGLMEAGWAVAPGERFRISSPPAVRIAHATLGPEEAAQLVADLSQALRRSPQRSA